MPSILLLEDNADMLTMLSQVLEWGGHQVLAARNGAEGLALLSEAQYAPSLIVCDLLMPNMDGATFLEHVRSNPDWSNIPFVMMSARSTEEEQKNVLSLGADGFLTKPFSLDDLSVLLDEWGLDT
jgi:CheY-like chemotaxis protein